MCHLSPTVHLAWAILSCGLQIILVQHLWRYDRFKCLKWSSGRQPGTFKRVMTYSYCASVPLLLVYSVSMAVFKYKHGYSLVPEHGIVPTPYLLWPVSDRAWLTPLYLVFSIVWGLELVTHMEELTFWLFLLHQGPTRREWFSSIEFKTWAVASLIAMCGMPLTAIFKRSDPLQESDLSKFNSASTCITAVFFIVLFKFPAFLRRVKKEGAAGPVVLRLVKFHELNIMRVVFRLLFTLPLLILGIDGVMEHHTLNQSALWSDFLAFIAAFGTVISSTLTLLIFFPRSLAEDSNWRPRSTETHSHGSYVSAVTSRGGQLRPAFSRTDSEQPSNPFLSARDNSASNSIQAMPSQTKTKYYSGHFTSPSALTTTYYPPTLQSDSSNKPHAGTDWNLRHIEEGEVDEDTSKAWRGLNSSMALTYDANRVDEELSERDEGTFDAKATPKDDKHLKVRMMELGQAVDAGLKKPPRPPRLHPYIMSFTSPIDLLQDDEAVPRAL